MDSIDGVASLLMPCLVGKTPLSAGSSDTNPDTNLDSIGTAGSSDLKPVYPGYPEADTSCGEDGGLYGLPGLVYCGGGDWAISGPGAAG